MKKFVPSRKLTRILLAALLFITASIMGVAEDVFGAAEHGNADFLRTFVSSGGDVNARDAQGRTPLMLAANGGYGESVKVLLAGKANVNLRDSYGNTAVYLAAVRGASKVVALLVAAKADVNVNSASGESPLGVAARMGEATLVRLLIRGGANLNAADQHGLTPLMVSKTTSIAKLLITSGADVNGRRDNGDSALIVAIQADREDLAVMLIKAKADVNAPCKGGMTALMWAASNGDLDSLRLIIAEAADVDAPDYRGETALLYAATAGNVAAITALLAAGADVNARTTGGDTALICAMRSDYPDAAEVLLEAGASAGIRNAKGESASSLSVGHPALVDVLESAQIPMAGDTQPLEPAASDPRTAVTSTQSLQGWSDREAAKAFLNLVDRGTPAQLRAAIAGGAPVNFADWSNGQYSSGLTPLMKAVWRSTPDAADIVRSLIAAGAYINVGAFDKTAIDLAVARPNPDVEIVRVLCEAGAIVRPVTLMLAVTSEHPDTEIVGLLLSEGAPPTYRSEDGRTPLMIAVQRQNLDVVRLLLAYGARVNDMDDMGKTAADLAASPEIQALLQHCRRLISLTASSMLTEPTDRNAYHPVKLFDGNPRTGWFEGEKGSGIGESLSLTFDTPVTVDKISAMPGYFWAQYWKQNYRVKTLEVKLDSKVFVVAFKDSMVEQYLALGNPVTFTTVVLTIKEVYPTTKWDDTAISELSFYDRGTRIVVDFSQFARFLKKGP